MNWQIIITAFGIGLLSSFHCVGMCGAIALSIPTPNHSILKKTLHILAYNFGRIVTYSCMGILFGLLGRQMNILGFQRWFSIAAGVFILIAMFQMKTQSKSFHFIRLVWLQNGITKMISAFINNKSLYGTLMLGIANGLLPCGLVYLAITGALAVGSILGGGIFMAAFGLGTLPALFLVSYFGFFISLNIRNKIKKTMPFVIASMAVLLILRGIGLGIPIISPSVVATQGQVIGCH